ncbi:MAG TPA: hypothetical protein VLB07_03705 [Woeseiaceae bacterium]|nr:hypothetical protein [Woeseiaceae bacterium]
MSSWLVDFASNTLAGIVGVFVGIWLALITERHREARTEKQLQEERAREFDRARHTILGSVVKNTSEARRLRHRVDERKASEIIHTNLEVAVWQAVQAQFMEACHDIDERVRFAQFFDGVRGLQAYFEFHRDLQLSIAAAASNDDPELAAVLRDADQRLRDLSDEQHLNGVMLITDFGDPVHKRLLGLKSTSA